MPDIFVLRDWAQSFDLRNRVIEPDNQPVAATIKPAWMCHQDGCKNTLTITDYGLTCRECRLTA